LLSAASFLQCETLFSECIVNSALHRLPTQLSEYIICLCVAREIMALYGQRQHIHLILGHYSPILLRLVLISLHVAGQNIITTFAGVGPGGDGALATNVALNNPQGVALDVNNHLVYITDSSNHVIRVMNLVTNVITTIAGIYGVGGYNVENGFATNVKLNSPRDLAFDSTKNILFIADSSNSRIRAYNVTSRIITTIAGGGTSTADIISALNAQLLTPLGIAVDTIKMLLYFSDYSAYKLRVVNFTSGNITTLAGTGVYGYFGNNGLAINAKLRYPYGVHIDTENNLVFIADYNNNQIRVVNRTTNIISAFAGVGDISQYGQTGDNGQATSALLYSPTSVCADAKFVYITDQNNQKIRMVNRTSGNITTLAGTGASVYNGDNIPAINANLYYPAQLAVDTVNNILYIADSSNERIRAVDLNTKYITTVAGSGSAASLFFGDNGPAVQAALNNPYGIAIDSSRRLLYFTDSNNNRIRVINMTSNIISTVATSSGYPTGIAFDPVNNWLYIAANSYHIILKLDRNTGTISTVAGFSGFPGSSGDNGLATSSRVNSPRGIALDMSNSLLYIADTDNNKIRVINRITGFISTFAGGGGSTINGVQAITASLSGPHGVTVDTVNNLVYIANTYFHTVRVVNSTSGIITTVAGTGVAGYSGDGGLAIGAKLNTPTAVTVDTNSNLVYIAEGNNNCVRVVNRTSGIISTFAGICTSLGYSGDGGLAMNAYLSGPLSMAIDPSTNSMYIADSANNKIRVVKALTSTCPSGYTGSNCNVSVCYGMISFNKY
jgi:DNA-binding beta-propeller fold protein YncE